MKLQERGIATVLVATSAFENLARTLAEHLGYPDLPIAVIAHPFTDLPEDVVMRVADESQFDILSRIVHGLSSDLRTGAAT